MANNVVDEHQKMWSMANTPFSPLGYQVHTLGLCMSVVTDHKFVKEPHQAHLPASGSIWEPANNNVTSEYTLPSL